MTEILREEIERIPTGPPRSADLLPGLRYKKGVSPMWLPVILLLFVPVAFLIALSQSPEGKLAFRATRIVSGRVESVDRRNVCRGGASIGYSFTTLDGVARQGRARACPPSPYTDVGPGDAIPVRYLESDPSMSRVGSSRIEAVAAVAAVVVVSALVALMVGAMFWPLVGRHRRDRKLFQTGQLVRGRVSYVKTQLQNPWNASLARLNTAEVYVRVGLDGGAEREVTTLCTNQWLALQLSPGSEVHVCVVDDRAMLVENYLR